MTQHDVVFTVGHGRDSFDAFLARIRPHGVTTIADVRSHPTSRRAPDFRKQPLEEAAAASGIGYRWLGGTLGGRPDDPALLDETGRPRWEAIAQTPSFRSGITELVGLTASGVVAVMCAETDPRWCHRTMLVTPALVQRGLRVRDILGDGSVAPPLTPLG